MKNYVRSMIVVAAIFMTGCDCGCGIATSVVGGAVSGVAAVVAKEAFD